MRQESLGIRADLKDYSWISLINPPPKKKKKKKEKKEAVLVILVGLLNTK